ncbi:hypothetical protein [Steroidobacter cummioxidans]|uniref:hypothetical protein n=1 Tax=Steroidobacter cummioxidans TaxID=1803913 RepID=UPI000E311858|nr:hypothetical protein [Steroidobacter cummioxidans]
MRSCVLFGCLVLASTAYAQPDDPFDHRFSISAGAFWPEVDTTVKANGTGSFGLIGTTIDLESDLGLADSDTLYTGGMTWNFGRRHSLDLLYFELGRTATKTIDHTINFRGQSYPLQTSIHSLFRTDVARLSYYFAFIADDRQRLTGQFGVHYTKVKADLDAATGSIRAEADSDVPLPVIGLGYQRRLGNSFLFDANVQIFRLEFDDLSGSLNNGSANFYWGPTQHFSIFVGYDYYSMNVDARKEHWNGSFDFRYKGPWAGLVVGFGSRR